MPLACLWKKLLQVISDVAFDLLRWHAWVKGRHGHHRDVHRRKRSTGIRTTLTTPTIVIRRQITVDMGFYCKRDIVISPAPSVRRAARVAARNHHVAFLKPREDFGALIGFQADDHRDNMNHRGD